jgi:hypothetical protein
MLNAYYTGAAYNLAHAVPFPSGQAYCQSAGSYLYCADVEAGGAMLLSMRDEGVVRARIGVWRDLRDTGASFSGLLSTRTVDGTTQLVGALENLEGRGVAVDCAGPLRGQYVSLNCRAAAVAAAPR